MTALTIGLELKSAYNLRWQILKVFFFQREKKKRRNGTLWRLDGKEKRKQNGEI